ncbi:hypothetical protein M405DRAFT_936358 [Rhizopogon salebrosus TDB-379]|nr:hypothetical protein M405DRAFT_936358 [Rhizopogon salebrosus TDB-379]
MVNRRTSEDIKQCALRLWNHGWDVQDICFEKNANYFLIFSFYSNYEPNADSFSELISQRALDGARGYITYTLGELR